MAQIKIYGLKEHLNPIKMQLSDLIHACVMEAFGLPEGKRAHRFFPLAEDDFYYPADRSSRYTIIEISLFEGRSIEAKKQLFRLLFERAQDELNMAPLDLEITLTETPRHNWGIRGVPGDELDLNYKIEV